MIVESFLIISAILRYLLLLISIGESLLFRFAFCATLSIAIDSFHWIWCGYFILMNAIAFFYLFLVSHLLYRYKSRKNFSARLVDKKIRRYYNIEVVNLIYFYIGMWLSLVERLVRDEEAAGSNPVIPILQSRSFERFLFFVLHYVAVENDDEIKGAIAISDAPFVYEKS